MLRQELCTTLRALLLLKQSPAVSIDDYVLSGGLSYRLCSVFVQELCSVLRALAQLMLGQEPCRAKLLESSEALPAILSALGGLVIISQVHTT